MFFVFYLEFSDTLHITYCCKATSGLVGPFLPFCCKDTSGLVGPFRSGLVGPKVFIFSPGRRGILRPHRGSWTPTIYHPWDFLGNPDFRPDRFPGMGTMTMRSKPNRYLMKIEYLPGAENGFSLHPHNETQVKSNRSGNNSLEMLYA